MKRKVPRRIPRILPFIRHRNHIRVVQVFPLVIATANTLAGRFGCAWITIEPLFDDVVIELFGPEHAGEGLPHDEAFVSREVSWDYGFVKLIGFTKTIGEYLVELCEGFSVIELLISSSQADRRSCTCADGQLVIRGRFGASLFWIHCLLVAVNDVFVDRVFEVTRTIRVIEQPLSVRD